MNGTKKYRSVFLGYENGKVFANKNYGSLKYMSCEGNGQIFASSFPAECYVNETVYDAPQYFVEGQKMKLEKQKRYYDFGAYGVYAY